MQVTQPWAVRDLYLFPAIQLAVFAAAVATTFLVRQAVYAAILSIAVVYVGVLFGLLLCLLPKVLELGSLRPLFIDPTQEQVAFALLVSFFASTILAWLAVH